MKFNEIRNTRIQVINEYQKYVSNDPGLTKEEAENRIIQFMNATDQPIIFAIPDHLQCRITLELMEDPVTTDCGQTYERSAIEEHIQRNGKTDPFTRSPLKGPLYPNVSIKKAIADFLNNNPWAYEYSEGENYKDIVF